jgi:hypothetical protein
MSVSNNFLNFSCVLINADKGTTRTIGVFLLARKRCNIMYEECILTCVYIFIRTEAVRRWTLTVNPEVESPVYFMWYSWWIK